METGKNRLLKIQIMKTDRINDAEAKVVNKEARYRYVIDTATV
jgi:D-arabinose 1-dehydrogenase-like Zn-dependent alcohol dehydrogenase